MPHVRLLKDSPEGGSGQVVHVSRSRAHDLVTIGHATRTLSQGRGAGAASPTSSSPRPAKKRSA